jgi:hypothetical protein
MRVIIFSGADLTAPRASAGARSMQTPADWRAAPNQLASDRKISTELDPSDFPVLHFSVFARRLTKNAGLTLSE